jgi:hypothetical protein
MRMLSMGRRALALGLAGLLVLAGAAGADSSAPPATPFPPRSAPPWAMRRMPSRSGSGAGSRRML